MTKIQKKAHFIIKNPHFLIQNPSECQKQAEIEIFGERKEDTFKDLKEIYSLLPVAHPPSIIAIACRI